MMEDKERANMILRRIGEMPYFDSDAIVKVLVNEFELVRKEAAQPSAQDGKPWTCSVCGYKNNGFRKRCGGCMADYDEQGRGI